MSSHQIFYLSRSYYWQRRSSVTKSGVGAQFIFPNSEKQKKKRSQRRNIRQYVYVREYQGVKSDFVINAV